MELPVGNTIVKTVVQRPNVSGRATEYTSKVAKFIEGGAQPAGSVVEITRYPNRKIYMTEISSYISYVNLAQLVAAGYVPKVTFTKTKMDITQATLHHVLDQLGGLGEVELRQLITKCVARRTSGES